MNNIVSNMPRDDKDVLLDMDPEDRELLLQWNGKMSIPRSECVHHLIEQNAHRTPNAPAVLAWDGQLTFKELDSLSSSLATQIRQASVGPEVFVPLCFDKSLWITVAMLGVLKAGGAFTLIDPSHPTDRIHTITETVEAKVAITSPTYQPLLSSLVERVIVVGGREVHDLNHCVEHRPEHRAKTTVCLDNAMYAAFTSGSTSKPKGVVISHMAFATAAVALARMIDINRYSRVFQAASYAFDASIMDMLAPLVMGGCVCIPSHSDVQNQLAASIRRFQVTLMMLTPSLVRVLRPEDIPSVKTMVLVGEAISASDISVWAPHVRLMQGYGPTECSVASTVQSTFEVGSDCRNVGSGHGCLCWIVNPDDHEKLMPIGEVGELLIEGPIVGRGYLKSPEQTLAAFVKSPRWLTELRAKHGEVPQRLYKSGDLVQYATDGSLLFIGRKDNQIKLRGQRIELGAVETSIQECFQGAETAVAEVIPGSAGQRQMLVGFVTWNSRDQTPGRSSGKEDARAHQAIPTEGSICLASTDAFVAESVIADRRLREKLPSYMVPSMFIQLRQVPVTLTGKTDRQLLRKEGVSFLLEQRASSKICRDQITRSEEKLLALCAQVLGLSMDRIALGDDFLRLGGDSVAAIELSSACRAAGLRLTVADILTHRTITRIAEHIEVDTGSDTVLERLAPFSLVSGSEKAIILTEAAYRWGIDPGTVEDTFPCTPLQEGLMALSQKKTGAHIAQQIVSVVPGTDRVRLAAAWVEVGRQNGIMRTRIVDTSVGIMQIVTNEPLSVYQTQGDPHIVQEYMAQRVCLGEPLVNIAISAHEQRLYVVWTAHHAACDGWQSRKIFDSVERCLQGHQIPPSPNFNQFVEYVLQQNTDVQSNYWAAQLEGPPPAVFPARVRVSADWANRSEAHFIHLEGNAPTSRQYPMAGKIQLAWALVSAAYAESPDVVFGMTLSGRNAPVAGIEHITGPTIATVPFRVRLDMASTVGGALDALQIQSAGMVPHEQTGLQTISRLNPEAAAICDLQCLLVIQTPPTPVSPDAVMIPLEDTKLNRLPFSNYPLTLECTMVPDRAGLDVGAHFDEKTISGEQVRHVLHQFGYVLSQLHANPDAPLSSISLLSPLDQANIARWNATCPNVVHQTLNDLVKLQAQARPDALAIHAWDGDFTYGELDHLSSGLALYLQRELQVKPDDAIPVCLKKSKMTALVMMAVLKTGAFYIPVDFHLPPVRLAQMIANSRARVALALDDTKATFSAVPVEIHIQVISSEWVKTMPPSPPQIRWNRSPERAAFVVYTSGSTGQPKGVVLQHQALATSMFAHGPVFNIGPHSRMLQLASSAFDIHIYEHLTTLVLGGCVCVPSEEQRMSSPAQTARNMRVSVTLNVPTTMRAMGDEKIETLTDISLGGEPIAPDVVELWGDRARIFNGYGPAECTICSAYPISPEKNPLSTIGTGLGCVFWVVDRADVNRLAPIGVVGELLVEGPVLFAGYLNDRERSDAAFVEYPNSWLHLAPRIGQESKPRLYRTGDLVRYNPDGTVSFVGRRDTQTKLRGQRLELSEIEFLLQRQFPTNSVVADVVAIRGTEHLIAFVDVAEKGSVSDNQKKPMLSPKLLLDNEAALAYLALELPSYMMPSMILRVSRIPKTLSGKTDRKQLCQMAATLTPAELSLYQGRQSVFRRPSTDTERRLLLLWAEVLNLSPEEISVDDGFAARGGDSVGAMRLVQRAQSHGLNISVADFKYQKLAQQAELIDHRSQTGK